MKKSLFMLFYVLIVSYSAIAQEKYIVTGKSVNVRQGANKYSTVIGIVQKYDTVLVYSFAEDWAEINTSNGKGFISKNFIEKVEATAQTVESESDYSWIGGLITFLIISVLAFLLIRFIIRKIRQAFSSVSTKKSKPIKNNTEIKKPVSVTPFKGKSFELPSLNDLHTSDEATILDFLNVNSKNIGTVKYLGAFIDDVKITRETGIRTLLNYVLVERKEFRSESAGQEYKKSDGTRDIFEMSYDLPDKVEGETEEKNYVILSTIETHECPTIERCSRCNGSGRCSSCDGRGFNRCSSCEGTGKKEVRDGQYANGKPKYKKIACSSCHGTGRKTCTSCNGTCKCSRCDGSGKVTCSRCDGTGFYQSYIAYSNKYKSDSLLINYSEFEELKPILPKAQGNVGYEDELVEWINKSKLLFDNRETAKKSNVHAPEIINNLEAIISTDSSTTKVGRVSAKIESIPITFIDYKFEGNEYQLSVVGQNNFVCYYSIPTKHSYKQSIFSSISKAFNKTKRQIAFAYIASFILNADDNMAQDEIKLLEVFTNHIKLKQEKKVALLNEISRKLTIEEIIPKIACIKKDKRALVFAWQCAMQDKQINQSEIEAFNQLATFFKVKEDEIELLKDKASKFARLKESEMLEEYFK